MFTFSEPCKFYLKDLIDQKMTIKEQEKKLEQRYKALKAKNDKVNITENISEQF